MKEFAAERARAHAQGGVLHSSGKSSGFSLQSNESDLEDALVSAMT